MDCNSCSKITGSDRGGLLCIEQEYDCTRASRKSVDVMLDMGISNKKDFSSVNIHFVGVSVDTFESAFVIKRGAFRVVTCGNFIVL
jgi:hypothetical protein